MSDTFPNQADDIAPAPPRHFGGGRAICGLLLLAAVAVFGHRSLERGDVLAVFGPSGRTGGVMSLERQVFVAVSNFEMGEPWTAVTQSVSTADGVRLRDKLTDTPQIAGRWGFVFARQEAGSLGFPGKWCVTLAAPHWAFWPIGAWPVATWVVRRARQRRRRRRGWCLNCGYDLRGAGERCPECGTSRADSVMTALSGGR
jgi:hypothetical protein